MFVTRLLEQGTLLVVIVVTAGSQVFSKRHTGEVEWIHKSTSETISGTLNWHKWACPVLLFYQVTQQTTV